jgi:hypothetical protein
MTFRRSENSDDGLDGVLSGLPSMAPDPARTERVRARCHARLAGRLARDRRRRLVWKQVVAPALVGSFCVVYFALMLFNAFGAPTRVGGGL